MRRAVTCLLSIAALAGASACGGDGKDASSSAEARALLVRAATTPVPSAQLRGRIAWDIAGFPLLGSGPMELRGTGRVRSNGTAAFPDATGDLYFEGGGQSFPIRVVTTERNAWVVLLGRAYRVFPTARRATADAAPVTLRRLGLAPETWFDDPTVTSGPRIGGASTTRVSGGVDAPAVLADLAPLAARAGLTRLLGSVAPSRLADTVTSFTASVDVDRRGVARRVAGTLRFRSRDAGKTAGIEGGTVRFDVTVERTGVPVDARPPDEAGPLRALLRFAEQAFGLRLGS